MVDIPDIGKSNIHYALQSGIKDFEDATQIFCAYAGKADIIITRNKKDFAESSIPVKTPFEFLSEHEDWF